MDEMKLRKDIYLQLGGDSQGFQQLKTLNQKSELQQYCHQQMIKQLA